MLVRLANRAPALFVLISVSLFDWRKIVLREKAPLKSWECRFLS